MKYVDIQHHLHTSYKNYMYFNALLDTSQNYIPTTPETSVKVPLRKNLLNVKSIFMLILMASFNFLSPVALYLITICIPLRILISMRGESYDTRVP